VYDPLDHLVGANRIRVLAALATDRERNALPGGQTIMFW
jgi:hypothetical protein